jgi:hypothetical protein
MTYSHLTCDGSVCRFPLNIVFRIYDNVLASGIEAIFGFSVVLLQKNEEALLQLKFDDILAFLKTRLFEKYVVGVLYWILFSPPALKTGLSQTHHRRKKRTPFTATLNQLALLATTT